MALVNSVFTEGNHDDIIALGHSICSSGIDQWGIAPLLSFQQQCLTPAVPIDSMKVLLQRVVSELGTAPAQILFELELSQYQELTGNTVADRWRVEEQVEYSNVFLMAANFQPGYFVRLRWDGELLNKQDFRTLGLKRGSLGSYQPGALASIIG